jgi:hypothetical protein
VRNAGEATKWKDMNRGGNVALQQHDTKDGRVGGKDIFESCRENLITML